MMFLIILSLLSCFHQFHSYIWSFTSGLYVSHLISQTGLGVIYIFKIVWMFNEVDSGQSGVSFSTVQKFYTQFLFLYRKQSRIY